MRPTHRSGTTRDGSNARARPLTHTMAAPNPVYPLTKPPATAQALA
jgi:hypothetical protein